MEKPNSMQQVCDRSGTVLTSAIGWLLKGPT